MKLALYEWCWTSRFDPGDQDHQRLAEMLQSVTHISQRQVEGRTISAAAAALHAGGWYDVFYEDLADREQHRSSGTSWYVWLELAVSRDNAAWASCEGSTATRWLSRSSAVVLSQAGRLKVCTHEAWYL